MVTPSGGEKKRKVVSDKNRKRGPPKFSANSQETVSWGLFELDLNKWARETGGNQD